MLGWQILNKGEYLLDLPVLSEDEQQVILDAEERFKEATRTENGESKVLIERIIDGLAEEKGIVFEDAQKHYLSKVALRHIYGFAFMDELIADQQIEEISVIGPGKPVHVYLRKQGWKKVNAIFTDDKAIAEMINRMARDIGRHITLQNPRLDAMLPDGSRMHASLPPVSAGEITIRKFRGKPFSPLELAQNRTIPEDALALLSLLMQCDSSVIIAGNTASGKTTTLNALFSFVPGSERIIITEETPEINIPHQHQMRLVANKDMEISLKDLVYDTLRMRPDRIIVGEVRNREEVEALFDVLLAGQARGSYATFHAQSVNEAIGRLRSYGIREIDMKTIDCIIIQRRMLYYDKAKRENVELRRIVEIAEGEDGTLIYGDGKLKKEGKLLAKIAGSLGMSDKEARLELQERKELIAEAPSDFAGFYKAVQESLYGGR